MTVTAIICEYNPFHNGHKYLIDEARRRTGADYIIAIMSGNFVQRAESAIIDKWARTKACLKNGADLVVEIPCFASFAPANLYAYYSVMTACNLGVVDYLAFGSEEGMTPEKLSFYADKLDGLDEEFNKKVKESLNKGLSYAASISNACGFEPGPNDILGFEYTRALKKLNSNIKAVPIARTAGQNIISASKIRKKIIQGANDICHYMPANSYDILSEEITAGRAPVTIENFESAIMASLRTKSPDDIRLLPYVSEGLEYAIYKNVLAHGTLEKFISSTTCARYTSSRIRRICIASLLDIKASDLNHNPGFIKILGLRKNAGRLSDAITENCHVPADISLAKLAPADERLATLSSRSTNIYALGYPAPLNRTGDLEYTRSAIFEA